MLLDVRISVTKGECSIIDRLLSFRWLGSVENLTSQTHSIPTRFS